MSAFIVTHQHINTMLNFAAANAGNLSPCVYLKDDANLNFSGDQQAMAEILLAENVRSVQARYPALDNPDAMPGKIGEIGQPIRYAFTRPISPVQAIKACKCYDYQACEAAGYATSDARLIIEAIQNIAIHSLPGYDDAEWEIN